VYAYRSAYVGTPQPTVFWNDIRFAWCVAVCNEYSGEVRCIVFNPSSPLTRKQDSRYQIEWRIISSCVWVYIHIHICLCMCICIYLYVHMYTHIWVHVYIPTVYVYMCNKYMHIYKYTYVYVFMYVHVHASAYVYTYLNRCICIYKICVYVICIYVICIHIHINVCVNIFI